MPQNTPYPGESPQQFQMRMMQGGGPPPGAQQSPMMPQQGAPQAGQPGQDILQDPEQLKVLLATYGDQMEMSDYEKQMARVNALRDQLPEVEGRNSGRVYTAANPLEHIGKGLQQYAGKRKADKLQGQIDETRGRIGAAVGKYGEKILGEE